MFYKFKPNLYIFSYNYFLPVFDARKFFFVIFYLTLVRIELFGLGEPLFSHKNYIEETFQ